MTGDPSRRLVLLRHAKSAWPDVPDIERPLGKRGQRHPPRAGRWLRQAGYLPDLVVCSTARRTRETWQLAVAELGASPPVRFEPRGYVAGTWELVDVIREPRDEVEPRQVVGHEPAMHELTLLLASAVANGSDPAALDRGRLKFPTAAMSVLGFAGGCSP